MKTAVIKIGNSRGIRIPKSVLAECHIENEVDLILEKDKIIIIPFKERPRIGWEFQFKKMAEKNDDKLIIPEAIDLDQKDWEW